jgi:ADP-ribose diphosphatase
VASRIKIIRSKTLYRGRVLRLKLDEIIEPGKIRAMREIVEHSGSVVVLAIFEDESVLLVRQYRYAARQPLWELVAGGIEPGETVRQAARRELIEETGFKARMLRPLFSFFPSPGVLTERMHLVEARGLTQFKARPEPDERIETKRFPLARLRLMLDRKQIKDAKTLIGILWALRSRRYKYQISA